MSNLPIIETINTNIANLKNTKQNIKNAVNTDYDFINNEQIESYPDLIKQGIAYYKNRAPHATKEGTDLSFNAVPLKFENMTIKGNTEQASYTGKNLLNSAEKTINSITKNGIIFTKNTDGTFNVSGTATAEYLQVIADVLDIVKPAASFYFYCSEPYNLDNFNISLQITYNDNSIQYIIANEVGQISDKEIRTAQIVVYCNSSTTINTAENVKTMIIESSIPDNNFEPYVGGVPAPNPDYPQTIHVVTGENSIGVQGENLISGVLNDSATGKELVKTIHNNEEFYLYVQTNSPTSDKVYAFFNSSYAGAINISNNDGILTFGGSVNFNFNRIRLQSNTVASKNMLKLGSTATTYEPYVEPRSYPVNLGSLELCKIGDYQDYLYKENGNWYKYGAIGKVILDGTQNISLQSINDYNIANFLITFSENYYDLSKYQQMLADKFSKQTTSVSITQAEGFLPTLNSNSHVLGVYLRIKSSTANTTNSMNVWLSIHNTTVYYVLDTPTTTQITDTTLISQLEALDKAKENNGTTIITTSGDDLAPILNFTAYLKEVE